MATVGPVDEAPGVVAVYVLCFFSPLTILCIVLGYLSYILAEMSSAIARLGADNGGLESLEVVFRRNRDLWRVIGILLMGGFLVCSVFVFVLLLNALL
ncbi:MAG: hypothetical protein AAGA48_36755 [Myxococcota bacterium]